MATFTNTATLSYNNLVTNSNVVTGEILEVVTVSKAVLNGSYGVNDTLTYVISIVNPGETAVTNVTVSDNLGAYMYNGATVYPLSYVPGSVQLYVNGVLAADPTVSAGPPLVFSGITVPADSNVILIYEASVTSYAPLAAGSSIVNTATVDGDNFSLPVTVSAEIDVRSEPSLTISKSVCPETVVENGVLTYTFVIQNSGSAPAVAADNVTVTDDFDPILSDITVTLDGDEWSSPANYTYNEATGEFATVPGQITVPAATFAQGADGRWIITPGVAVLRVTGTV